MEVKDIDINKIKEIDNVRQRKTKTEVTELMISIKQNDLLHPIGVCTSNNKEYLLIFGSRRLDACKKLGWNTIPANILKDVDLKDLIIKNTTENLHRRNISAAEEGRVYSRLKKDYNMTPSEIASRFGLSNKRILDATGLYEKIPDEYYEKVEFFTKRTKNKKGKIPASTATTILDLKRKLKLNKDEIMKLFELGRQDYMSRDKLHVIATFLKMGNSVDDAVLNAKKYELVNLVIPIEKKQYKQLGGTGMKVNKKITDILNGKTNLKLNILSW